ncbi:MAG: fibrobacter succinogenes major paralogous domain-containing protein [Prevotellaceae bacterium]|jgi:hypothetical protein|nr:fibrobacter succinogenes major paralogous domain-containing protein [Prevotellaceae bacterium]
MKTTKTKQFLFLAAFCYMAASVAAQTVDVTLQCGQTYTINSTAPATAADGLTYRWLENGSTVTGTAASYTVPATKHAGTYTYIRQAKTEDCSDWQNSNAFTVAVVNPNDGTCIAGITWAKYNVDVPGSFTTSPEDLGMLYKWDSLKYMSPTETEIPWDLHVSPNDTWSADQDPCPNGWHVPTAQEWRALMINTPGYVPWNQFYVLRVPFPSKAYDGGAMGPGCGTDGINDPNTIVTFPILNVPFVENLLVNNYWISGYLNCNWAFSMPPDWNRRSMWLRNLNSDGGAVNVAAGYHGALIRCVK